MKAQLFLGLFLVIFIFLACKSQQKTSSGVLPEKTSEKTLVVAFFSRGGGIDHSGRKLLDSLLVSKTEIDCDFTQVINKHGREGEREYCLKFQDNRCYNKAYAAIVTKLGDKDLIRIEPNGKCRK